MKIAVVMGTYRKNGAGAGFIRQIEQALACVPGIETDTIWLGDCGMKLCRGCMACYDRGEAACPLKDGYLDAMQRLNSADAAIFYSPVYTLSISGLMKTFFDRSSWVLHRPYFKGRHALVLTSVAAWGERPALKTLNQIVSMMGFSVAASLGVVTVRYDNQPKYRARIDRAVGRAARLLAERAASGKPVKPKLFELFAFRFQQAVFGRDTEGCRNDKQYWRQAGWASPETDFYCKAKISPVKRFLAKAVAGLVIKSGLLSE